LEALKSSEVEISKKEERRENKIRRRQPRQARHCRSQDVCELKEIRTADGVQLHSGNLTWTGILQKGRFDPIRREDMGLLGKNHLTNGGSERLNGTKRRTSGEDKFLSTSS